MRRYAVGLVLVLAAAAVVGAGQLTPAQAVAALRGREATYGDWKPILEIGKPAIPELGKLLSDKSPFLRAQAAVLLYRLGEAKALDAMAALLESPDEAARKEAAEGLLAFVGQPMGFRPSATEGERAAALRGWKAWWKSNRDKALAQPPMKHLYGKVTAVGTGLVLVSLSGRHGLKSGMALQVRRGKQFVCKLDVVAAAAEGGGGRIVPFSKRTDPQVGDPVFVITP